MLEFIVICLLIYLLYRLVLYINFRINDVRIEKRRALKEAREPRPYRERRAEKMALKKAAKQAAKQAGK